MHRPVFEFTEGRQASCFLLNMTSVCAHAVSVKPAVGKEHAGMQSSSSISSSAQSTDQLICRSSA